MAPFFRLFFKPRIVGRENLPVTGPCFVIGNHSHTYDAFMANLWMYDEPTAGIITEEYFRGGLVTWALRNVGSVKTRKYQPQSTPVRQILRLIKDNRMFVIMPEGERNWDGVTRPTVASTGKLFRRLGVPVHPFIVHNGYKAWPRWAHWPRRIQVTIEFKPPFIFEPGMTDEEVARRVDEAVLWTPDQDMPEYPATATNGFRPADGITKLIFRCPDCADDRQLRTSRGRYLHCDGCGTSWKVGGDSYLTNIATGDSISSTAAYHKICAMPRKLRKWERFGEAYLLARDLPVYFEEEFPAQKKLGRFDCLLRADKLALLPTGSKGNPFTIPFNEIQTISIEKKYKLQVRVAHGLYQINFKTGSALQWEYHLRCMLPVLGKMLYSRENNPSKGIPVLPPD